MHRSRTQIATSYAPGSLFTYEGGLGCCVSVALSTPYTPSTPAVQKQLFEHLTEFVESWFERAMRCRAQPEVLSEQCVDSAFLDYKREPLINSGRFALNQPSRIGFMPDPLVFVCSEWRTPGGFRRRRSTAKRLAGGRRPHRLPEIRAPDATAGVRLTSSSHTGQATTRA